MYFEPNIALHVTYIEQNLSCTDMWSGEMGGMKYLAWDYIQAMQKTALR